MKTVLLLVLLVVLVGCASVPMSVVMTNPTTGESRYVSHYSYGYGVKGIAAALVMQEQQRKAIEAARMMGFTQMKEVK